MTANVQKQSEYAGVAIPAGVLTRVFGAGAQGRGEEAADFLLALSPGQMWDVSIRHAQTVLRLLQTLPVNRRVILLSAPKMLYALSMTAAAGDVWHMADALDDDAKIRVLRADGAMQAALGDATHAQGFFAFVRHLNETGRYDDAARILHSARGMAAVFVTGRERELARLVSALPEGDAKDALRDLYRDVERDFTDMLGDFFRPQAATRLRP